MKITHILLAVIAAGTAINANGQAAYSPSANDNGLIPRRAIILQGNPRDADDDVIGVFYSREDLDFNDPNAPRFLLLDRKGKVAFGFGGSLYAVGSYDFDGAIDSRDFTTYDIPVPRNPAERQRFGADASNSTLVAKLVGKSGRLGMYTVYFQAKFSGDNGKYGFTLKQAYAKIWRLTAGLTNSTFVDADAQAPTIDPQGDCGQVSEKNMLFRYTFPAYKGFGVAVSIEVPRASYTYGYKAGADATAENATSCSIAQRVPDIPAYIQYRWGKDSHVRVSAIFRDLAYRDLVSGKNHLVPGWGVKLSTLARAGSIFQPFGHVSYGKGISSYVNDLSGNGYDLVPDEQSGKLKAIPSLTYTIGTYLNFTSKCFATCSFSRAQVFDCSAIGPDSYRYGMYAAANCFYDYDDNFRIGAEYLYGRRTNYDGSHAGANRIEVLLQYSF